MGECVKGTVEVEASVSHTVHKYPSFATFVTTVIALQYL